MDQIISRLQFGFFLLLDSFDSRCVCVTVNTRFSQQGPCKKRYFTRKEVDLHRERDKRQKGSDGRRHAEVGV